MRTTASILTLLLASGILLGQDTATSPAQEKLFIGGYGEIHYNKKIDNPIRNNGALDVHRMVLFVAYQFDDKTLMLSEIEFEHVSEVYIEQLYLEHAIHRFASLRVGLLLMPMSRINLYHEPPLFHGVERPFIEQHIIPTTWREIGAGVTGNLQEANLSYQLYVVNGFNSYSGGKGLLGGSKGLRGGRQKGAESIASHPNLTGRIAFSGIPNTTIGVSGYMGKTQSELFDGLTNNESEIKRADSSVIGIQMLTTDMQFKYRGFGFASQIAYSTHQNTAPYNHFTGRDVGKAMLGYNLEAGYDILRLMKPNSRYEWVLFSRYEDVNTHHRVSGYAEKNAGYHLYSLQFGMTWKMAPGAVLKSDVQFVRTDEKKSDYSIINLGAGFMF